MKNKEEKKEKYIRKIRITDISSANKTRRHKKKNMKFVFVMS